MAAATEKVQIRAPKAKLSLIDRARELFGQNRTQFMLDAACSVAAYRLAERKEFSLSKERYAAFLEALDAPPCENAALHELLNTAAPWE